MEHTTTDTLLCTCLRSHKVLQINPEDFAHFSISGWEQLVQHARRHGLVPLLYSRFKEFSSTVQPPDSILQQVHSEYLRKVGRSMQITHQLAKILRPFRQRNIPVIVLKGTHLGELVYQNPAFRPMCDIDLLVRQQDLSAVTDALTAAGYHPSREFWLDAETETRLHLPVFIKPNSLPVEVHWALTQPQDPFQIDIDNVWERAQSITIAGVDVLGLCLEDLLLYLCIHIAFRHRFAVGLIHLYDIAEILRIHNDGIDWKQVHIRANQWGVQKSIYLVLTLIKELLHVSPPGGVLDDLEPVDGNSQWLAWANEQVFPLQEQGIPLTPDLANVLGTSRLRDKIRILLKTIFPSPHVMSSKYPIPPSSKRIYLYYPIRILDLLRRYKKTLWQRLRHKQNTTASIQHINRADALVKWMTVPPRE